MKILEKLDLGDVCDYDGRIVVLNLSEINDRV
jgi:hypothetical protein